MKRRSGVLLHPTSLPGDHGSGDLGEHARHFIDWLVSAGQSAWQMLPLGIAGLGNSPYMSQSAFAGNPALVDLHELHRRGWLDAGDVSPDPAFVAHRVDYGLVTPWRLQRLERASQRFRSTLSQQSLAEEFAAFRQRHAAWLEDHALFEALSECYPGTTWNRWPHAIAQRDPQALAEARRALALRIDHWCFVQWCFERQWQIVREYARARGISLIGDVPIFVALHSVDVWSQPHLFQLDAHGEPEAVAGVPPDYFSPTGQRWGNPLYRWEVHAREGFAWWVERMRRALAQVDEVRIDHFRGFAAYWRVPNDAPDARTGEWVAGPGDGLFAALQAALGSLPVIAEDLGLITPDVHALRHRFGLPGMAVLQFAWDGDTANPHLPHNHERTSVVYTGTHDNDTTLGWWQGLDEATRQRVRDYFGGDAEAGRVLLRAAQSSVADTAILPMQDILALGTGHRMNTPGLATGCWEWRFDWSQVGPEPAQCLSFWSRLYGRETTNRSMQ